MGFPFPGRRPLDIVPTRAVSGLVGNTHIQVHRLDPRDLLGTILVGLCLSDLIPGASVLSSVK